MEVVKKSLEIFLIRFGVLHDGLGILLPWEQALYPEASQPRLEISRIQCVFMVVTFSLYGRG